MDKYAAALAAFGGLTAIGRLLDLLLYRDRKRIENWMIAWWVRFEDVRWSNFGREEAEQAIAILDRIAGSRLWTHQRARAVLSLSLFLAVLAVVWLAGASLALPPAESRLPLQRPGYWHLWPVLHLALPIMLASMAMLALSISVTRWLGRLVVLCRPQGLAGAILFLALLITQCLMLLYWNDVVVRRLVGFAAWPFSTLSTAQVLDLTAATTLKSPIEAFYELLNNFRRTNSGAFDLSRFFNASLALCANGIRIGFALFFLSSYIFGPIVKPFVSRIWEALIESRRPIFTALFCGLGALYGAALILIR